ncbi:hypothetical protein GB931_15515 [Modestobacter sp. I12A-02628]|uniref:Uncharacterized protein n=1 Tax=Goekera deserti TaxID=2497753 RepID=A0A7K3WL52_9ACTN|nr:hypothetical protein [Goekera deserti]MPQ99299.1 hypothetical protein [Goekera deserti]NDI50298.1 hypothetical protein [Goekera deserti]NEL56450.1 hypothetical protein [Goekera deserti]
MTPALDDPGTRDALAAHRAGALRWLGGGVIGVVLAVLVGVAASTVVRSGGDRVGGAGLVLLVLLLGGLAGVVAGVGALLRTRRWAAALAVTPWSTGRLRSAGPALLLVEPDDADPLADPLRLQLLSTAIWRTRAVSALQDAEVRYAPAGAGQWVLTADATGTLLGARDAARRARRRAG